MKAADILRLRLEHQAIARPRFDRAEDVAAWFGAVQAQDYLGALWALGSRMRRVDEPDVEAAESRRSIVRLWPMRGTLHFVAAEDARWISRLLAPRVIVRNSARWKREFDIDARLLARADEVVTAALTGGKRLTREHLYEALESRRIRTGGSRGLHLLLWLAMQGRLCLAGRDGKQQTFALLDEWLPSSRVLEGEEALHELALRYFTSHGPAARKDFAWWTGLTLKEVAVALDGAEALSCATVDGIEYWWRDSGKPAARRSVKPRVRLLPAYDEYTVGYQDRSLLLEPGTSLTGMAVLAPAVLVDGRIVGTWKRTLEKRTVVIETRLARRLNAAESSALHDAADTYGEFLGLPARLAGHRG